MKQFLIAPQQPEQRTAGNKHVLFVFRKSKLEDEAIVQNTTLHNLITKALNWEFEDVLIADATPCSLRWSSLAGENKPKICVLFGIEASEFGLHLNIPEHQLFTYKQTTFLKTKAIEVLEKQVPIKKKFWELLQEAIGKNNGIV